MRLLVARIGDVEAARRSTEPTPAPMAGTSRSDRSSRSSSRSPSPASALKRARSATPGSPRIGRRGAQRSARLSQAARATNGPQAFAGSDACVTPVLNLEEAPLHPHNVARGGVGRGAARPAPPQARRKPEIRFVAGSGRRRSAGFRGLNEGRRYCSAADIDLRRSPRRTSATDKRSETALAGREGGGAPQRPSEGLSRFRTCPTFPN